MDSHNTILNWTINGISIGAIVSSLLGFIPSIAALIAAGYYAVQIWESETLRRWRSGRRAKKIAALKAQLQSLEAHDPAVPLPPKT
jgi:hypothetical protein